MKYTYKRFLACLLMLLMSGSTVACTGSKPSVGTDPVGTDDSSQVVTDGSMEGIGTNSEIKTEQETEPVVENFEVTEENGTAAVVTPTGLSYNVTGYTAINNGTVTFSKDLIYTFPENFIDEKYNRFTITYTANQPMKVWVKYNQREEEDLFYIEEGEGSFSGLVPQFVENRHRSNLVSIRLEPCIEGTASFSLVGLSTEAIDCPGETYFLENNRFKLGISLYWGGAVSYLEDKTSHIEGLTNLINRHDTGRLIQQSYYGTLGENDSYESSLCFGQSWHYNPVQGGDVYGKNGRLIDLVISDDSVYMKSQPCDWAKDGSYTPFYTENTYTLEEDVIRVDNRAFDFSGWEHPDHLQELPAVYTVSYLDTFTCYTGDKPWTNDDVTILRDLPFWDHGYQIVYFREMNTETWFAWYNEEDEFGLGIYVPGIDTVGGGRYEPDMRDKSDMGTSTSMAGGANIRRLIAFEPLTYSYLLTTGSPEEIREAFTLRKEFVENSSLSEYSVEWQRPFDFFTEEVIAPVTLPTDRYTSGIINATNAEAVYDTEEDALKLTTGEVDDAYIVIDFTQGDVILDSKDYTTLKIEYLIPTTNLRSEYNSELYLCTGNIYSPTGDMLMWIPGLIKDGEYHVLTIDLTQSPYWNGTINSIRFDHFNGSEPGDVMYIRSIVLE